MAPSPQPTHTLTKRANGGGIAAGVIILLLIIAAVAAYFLWQKRRSSSRSSSANYPSPAPTGLKDWITDKFHALSSGRRRNRQNNGSGYEPSSRGFFSGGGGGGGGSGRTRGHALDPDEAWDTHVGNEAFLDEQELGLHAPTTYTGAGYGGPGGYAGIGGAAPPGYEGEEERSREIDRRYEEEMHGVGGVGGRASSTRGGGRGNPFGDEHAVGSSLRGVSPRPIDTGRANRGNQQSHEVDSPTERKSAFREEM